MKKRILVATVPLGLCSLWLLWPDGSAPPTTESPPAVNALAWQQYPVSPSPEAPSQQLPTAPLPSGTVPAQFQAPQVSRLEPIPAHPQFRPDIHYLDRHRVQSAGYDNTVHPDEDLLIPGEPTAVPLAPAQPATLQPQPDPTTVTPQHLAPTPAATIENSVLGPDPGDQPAPQRSQPKIPTTPNSPMGAATNTVATPQSGQSYDPNQPPGPEEDLLRNPPPSADPGASSDPSTPTQSHSSPETPQPSGDPPVTQSLPGETDSSEQATEETLPPPDRPPSAQPSQPEIPSTSNPPHETAPRTSPPGGMPHDIIVEPDAGHREGYIPHAPHGGMAVSPATDGVDPHADCFADTMFPSAKKCKSCHEQIYEEWASSSHAYAAISPMFQKFEQTINTLSRGTIGYFCMRCHAPVATSLGLPRHYPIYDSIPAASEGVTCVACHRVKYAYGKVNGERRIERGPVTDPVYGAGYGEGLREVLAKKDYYKIKSPGESGAGQQIHQNVIHFEQISSSHFCAPCHQVAVAPGISLEVVWAQYRASPAHKQGITCQECHMGAEPGVAAGYECGPVAVVNGKPVSPHRKHSNHMFYGPGYSIAHPGTFPFNEEQEDWTIEEWLEFDYRAGWGTKEFEDQVADGVIQCQFPPTWANADDRYDAREVVDANLKKLEAKRQMRHQLMENGSHLEGPIFKKPPQRNRDLKFHYIVENLNLGHNMPSGSLGAQPQLWLNVALTGPTGERLWESGYVDSNGDIADLHSLDVAAGRVPRDQQLFNLQTKFLITSAKGTDREMYLPIPTDLDQLPFIRPSAFPVTVMNHPPFIRMEAHSIPPTGSRAAKYRVPGRLIQTPGVYRLSVRMRSRAEPIYFMRYCRATPEMERGMNEWMLNFHEETFEFVVQ